MDVRSEVSIGYHVMLACSTFPVPSGQEKSHCLSEAEPARNRVSRGHRAAAPQSSRHTDITPFTLAFPMSLFDAHDHLDDTENAFNLTGASLGRTRSKEKQQVFRADVEAAGGSAPSRPRSAGPVVNEETPVDDSKAISQRRHNSILRAAERLVLSRAVEDAVGGVVEMDTNDGSLHPLSLEKQDSLMHLDAEEVANTLTGKLSSKGAAWWRGFDFGDAEETQGDMHDTFTQVVRSNSVNARALALAFLEMDHPEVSKEERLVDSRGGDRNSANDERVPDSGNVFTQSLQVEIGKLEKLANRGEVTLELKTDTRGVLKKSSKKENSLVANKSPSPPNEIALRKELGKLYVTGNDLKDDARIGRVQTQRALHTSAGGVFDTVPSVIVPSADDGLFSQKTDDGEIKKVDAAANAVRSLPGIGVDLGDVEEGFFNAIDARLAIARAKLEAHTGQRQLWNTKGSGKKTPLSKNATRKDEDVSDDDSDSVGKGLFKFNSQSQRTQPLRDFLVDHFDHPYPDDAQRDELAIATDMTRAQVSNWFINARVRIWRPMIMNLGEQIERENDEEEGNVEGKGKNPKNPKKALKSKKVLKNKKALNPKHPVNPNPSKPKTRRRSAGTTRM